MILSPPEKESQKYSPKIDKVFVNADQYPLSKNFQISPLEGTSVMKKKNYLGLFIFETSCLGASVREQRPKKITAKTLLQHLRQGAA